MLKVSIRAEFIEDVSSFYVMFNNVQYEVPVNSTIFENEFEIPTYGIEEGEFYIAGPDDGRIFLDYLIFSQDLKEGAHTFTWLGAVETESTDHSFANLNKEKYNLYGYSVRSLRGVGPAQVQSIGSQRTMVDMENNNSYALSSIDNATITDEEVMEIARYSLDGRQVDSSCPGIQIVCYSDGSVRKVLIK